MKNKRILFGALAVFALAGTVLYSDKAMAAVIPEGFSVGTFSFTQKTADEAQTMLDEYEQAQLTRSVSLDVDSKVAKTTLGDLGYNLSNKSEISEAITEYTSGDIIDRYMKEVELEEQPVNMNLDESLDENLLTAFIDDNCFGIDVPMQNATIRRENGTFIVTPSSVGKKVDTAATKKALDVALDGSGNTDDIEIKAEVAEDKPSVTTEELDSIKDVLGTCTTDFSSSGSARSKNLAVGAQKINGHVLMPGETLSGYECMQPFTNENGYETAKAYENGMVVDSVGGGACQVATTLYNAALRAEITITQRQNHSMIVSYIQPSADAAIAGTYKDIKITNNQPTPIYVEGYTKGKTITFTIYGKETRSPNRKIEFESEVLSTTPAGKKVEEDASLAPGQEVKVQAGHAGRKSRLWKVVTVDGVETERTIISTDTYNMSDAIYKVGTGTAETTAETAATAVSEPPVDPNTGETIAPGAAPTQATQETVKGSNPSSETIPAPTAESVAIPAPDEPQTVEVGPGVTLEQ